MFGLPVASALAACTLSGSDNGTQTALPLNACPGPSTNPIRVAAGATSPYTDPSGNVWAADTGFTGGVAGVDANQPVQGTTTPTIYDGQRYGIDGSGPASFSYSFPVPAGAYTVILKFTENYVTGPGQRVFGVRINGQSVLSNFDIYAESGGMWKAVDKTFPVSLTSAGAIDIAFDPGSVQCPKIDAIDIEPVSGADAGADAPPPPPPPPPADGGSGSVGPAASSDFVTADFTNMTSPAGVANVVVVPQLFGAATGGLANHGFSAVGNATTRSLIRALNLPLMRLNSITYDQSASGVSPLVQHALDLFPSTCTWVIGVDSPSAGSELASYFKANSPIVPTLWEVHNESQPGQSSDSYDADAIAIANAVKSVDSSYRVAGDQSAGLDIGDLRALVAGTDSSTLGLLDYHDYLYCNDGNNAPSDEDVCFARNGSSSNSFADDQQAVQQAVQGTFAAQLPVLLGEYNDECSASFNDLRAGTSVGAAFMVSATLGMAAVSTQPVWAATWDLMDDEGANYNLIDGQNNVYPQYYTLQRLIATMPGKMVNTSQGGSASGVQSWATKSGAGFGLAIVNSNPNDVSGRVALSHWPVNASGTGTATLWSYPQVGGMTSPVANTPGTTSTVTVSAGMTDSITVPGHSVVILSQ